MIGGGTETVLLELGTIRKFKKNMKFFLKMLVFILIFLSIPAFFRCRSQIY